MILSTINLSILSLNFFPACPPPSIPSTPIRICICKILYSPIFTLSYVIKPHPPLPHSRSEIGASCCTPISLCFSVQFWWNVPGWFDSYLCTSWLPLALYRMWACSSFCLLLEQNRLPSATHFRLPTSIGLIAWNHQSKLSHLLVPKFVLLAQSPFSKILCSG